MKKLLSVVLALAIIASCFTMITIFAGDTTTAKTVVNGDAESTGGWMNSHVGSGTTTIIEEPGNETNHVALATIGNVYGTVGYDFSPAIIQDADKNLAGGGAGVYNISFRYKAAEAGKTGKFAVNIASAYHGAKSNVTTLLGADAHAENTYYGMSPSSITMTDQWQTYTGTVTVTEAYLEMLKACEAAGKGNAQTLTIRLDGSGSTNAFANGVFNYYVDDMKIEKQPDPKGVKVEITEDFVGDGAYAYVRTESTGLKKEMAVDNKITKNFVIYNTSDVAIKIEAMYQNGWSNVSGVSSLMAFDEIPAGDKKTVTLTVPCDANGMVTDTVALSALTLRFNIRAASDSLKTGNAIIIATENNSEVAGIGSAARQGGTAGKAAVSTVTALPNTVVGYEIEKTGTDTGVVGTTGSTGGIFTAADIKEGKLTKTYTVYNTNDYEVTVNVALQATVAKNDGSGNTWTGRTSYATIPANSSAEITTYLDEGATAGKVIIPAATTVNEQEIDVTKVFIRLDIKKGNTITQGTAVVFAADEKDPISKFAGIGFTTTAVTELPKVTAPTATATPTPTPTPVPVVKGLKIVGTTKLLASGGTAAKYPTTAFNFTEADVVWDEASTGDGTEYTKKTGTITRVYNVYNDGDVAFRAGVTAYGGNRLANGTSAVVGWDFPTGTTGYVNHETEALEAQSVRTQNIVIPVYQLQDGTIVIKDSKSAMEIGGTKVTGYAPLNTLRLRVDFWDFEVGASMVIAPAEADENDIIYTLADTSAYATKTLVYELPNIAGATPTPTATATATPTPTAVPVKEVVNGDAENGSTGWAAILGGTTTIVTDPTDATNKVAMHVPAGQYHTASFSLGAAIIQDEANGYAGGGAGTYKITFRAKAEEGKGGKFTGYINSQWHQNSGATIGDYTLTHGTYCNGNGFDMTDSWQEFTVTINIAEAWLNNLYAAAAEADAATLAKIYNLTLRLDGSNKAFKVDGANNYFTYYVDDVVITKEASTTPTTTATTTATTTPTTTPTATAPAAEYVGMKFEVTQAVTSGYLYFRNASAGITAADIVDGKLTKSFEVYNMNDFDVPVALYYQNGWSSISGTAQGKATIAPKSKAIITTVVPVAETLDPAALSLRVDLGQAGLELPVGTSIIIAGEPGDEIFGVAKNAGRTGDGAAVSSGVTELPNYTVPTPTPVAQKVVSNGDAENGNKNWGAYMGGTTEVIVDPDNAENHIVKFTASGLYHTVNFDLGPAIINDPANGYNGAGAAKYKLSFRVKAEEGKGGKFNLYINSANHQSANSSLGLAETYFGAGTVNMTDQWQNLEYTFTPDQKYLDAFKYYNDNGKANSYILNLRLDGSSAGSAFGVKNEETGKTEFNGGFTYYIDDVQIEVLPPDPDPVGMEFMSTEVITGDHYVITSNKVFVDEPGFTGKKTLSYTIYNTSDEKLYAFFGYNVTHEKADGAATWAEAGKGQAMTILPERKVTLTAELDVKNGLVTVTNGGKTTQYTLDNFFLRFNFKFEGAQDTGNTVIIAGNSEDDIIYNVKSGYKLTAQKIAVLPDYIEASKADTAPKKENGNVENGLVNWGNIHGGKVEQVQPGAAGTGNAAKLVVSGTGKYQSLAFDLGPWIIYDKEEGYTGGGPGKYEVTFYAKGTKSGKFSVMLNSQLHLDQKGVAKEIGSGAAVSSTWIGGGSIDMTKGWKKYTVTFDVKADWYKQMQRLYDSNNANAAKAYQLALRFDGASGAFKNGPFSYMVDQVSVKKVASYSLATVTGVELELKEDTEGSTYLKTGTGIVNSSMIKDDQITKEFEITNTGTEPISIYFTLQATVTSNGKAAWVAPNSGETVVIEPGDTEIVSFTMDVNKDKTVTVGDEDVKLDKFFARFDLKNEDGGTDLVAGTKFKIVAIDKADYKAISQLTSSQAKSWTISPVYAKSSKTETGDTLPVAMIAAATFAFVGLAVVVAKKRRED